MSGAGVVLLALSGALGFCAAAGVLQLGPRRVVVARHTMWLSVAAAALTTALPAPDLTGHRVWDVALRALIVLACGAAGAVMDRRVLLGLSGAALLIAGASGPGLAAAAAVGASAAITATSLRFRRPKAVVGALVGASLAHAAAADARSMVLVAACLALVGLATIGRVRWTWIAVAAPLGVLAVAGAGYALVALQARSHLTTAVARARAALTEVTDKDAGRAQADFASARAEFHRARSLLDGGLAKPIEYVPGGAQNAHALQVMADVGEDLSAAGQDAIASRDLARFHVVNGRVDLAQLQALTGPADHVLAVLDTSAVRLKGVTSDLLAAPVTGPLQRLTARVVDAGVKAHQLRQALEIAPGLLGAGNTRTYFLAIQNPAESRASGGIIGDFAVVTFTKGKLALVQQGHDDLLNTAGNPAARKLIGPPDYLARYEPFGPEQTWQNVTMSPDFPSVGQVITQLFPQSGGVPVDGVVSVDPAALAALLQLTGPVQVPSWPVPVTKDNAEQLLLHDQYLALSGTPRIQFAADVVAAVFQRIETGALPDVRTIGRVLAPLMSAKHLMLYSPNADEQGLYRELDATGEVQHVGEDTLGVVTQNSSGNKIDWYLHRRIDDHVTVDRTTGAVDATVTVALENDAPAAGLPPIVNGGVGDEPTAPGENRTWLSLYTSLQLVDATANNTTIDMEREVEVGRQVFSRFLTIEPGATLTVVLHLKGIITPGAPYSLYVRAQPTVTPDDLTLTVNDRPPVRLTAIRDVVLTP